MNSRRGLIIVFIISFLIRLIALNQSLWLDEATSARVVMEYGYWDIVSKFSPFDFHPPLYYLFLKFWTNVFGYSEISLRFPSILFSLLAGYFVYKIAKLLNGYIVGPWAAIFFLFNPLIVYYSQEARMYMMTTFLLIGTFYFLIKMLQCQNSNVKSQNYWKHILFFNIFILLSFLTFYGSIFLIIPMLFYLFFKKKHKEFFVSYFMLYVTCLFVSPLLYQQFLHSKQMLSLIPNWKNVLGVANIKNLLLIPIKFSFGRISFYPKVVYYTIAGFWSLIIWYFVVRGGSKNKQIFFIMVITVIMGLIFSFFTPLLQYFRFTYLIPLMSLLLAFGVFPNKPTRFFRSDTFINRVGFLAGGFLLLSLVYLFAPQFHREDWKSLAKNLPKGAVVYMIQSSSDALKYYRKDVKIKDLISKEPSEREVLIVPYTSEIYGLDYKKNLTDNDYTLKEQKTFRELTIGKWIKNGQN